MIPITILIYRQKQYSPSRSEWRVIVKKMIEQCTGSSAKLLFDNLGKPYIEHPDTTISYSHTKDTLVLAFAHNNAKIGVDAENISRISDINEIQEFAFSEKERYPTKTDLVSNWCLKEATVKMYGRGFHDHDPAEIMISTEDSLVNAYVHSKEIIRGYFQIIQKEHLVLAICSDKEFSPDIKYWNELSSAEARYAA